MITTYNAENSLKSIYLPVITDLLNTQTNPLLTKIEQTSNDVWGIEIRKAIEHNGKYIQLVSTLKNFYGQVEISEKAIRVFNNNGIVKFMNLANDEFEKFLSQARNDFSRMLFSEERDSKWLTGIADIFDITKPLYGHERSELPLFMPIIKEVTELNDIAIEQAIDEVELNGGKVDFIAVSRDVKYAYVEQHKIIDIMQLNGGFKTLSHNGIPMVFDNEMFYYGFNVSTNLSYSFNISKSDCATHGMDSNGLYDNKFGKLAASRQAISRYKEASGLMEEINRDIYYITEQAFSFAHLSERSFLPSKKPITILYPSIMASLIEKLKRIDRWDSDKLKVKGVTEKLWFL